MNYAHANVSEIATVSYNAIAPTGGTTILTEYFGLTGLGGRLDAGESRSTHERILAPGDKMSFMLTCTEAVYGSLELIWYEHTDK